MSHEEAGVAEVDEVRKGFVVRGRVQGVGFRWWTRHTAGRLGVAGTVRNCVDGSVEVMAAGEASAVDRLEGELRDGPPMARVDAVEVVECDLPEGWARFEVVG